MRIGKNSHLAKKKCPMCRGQGIVKCPDCKGRGRPFDCYTCGEIARSLKRSGTIECSRCSGTGMIKRT